jgi:hypothetical protein
MKAAIAAICFSLTMLTGVSVYAITLVNMCYLGAGAPVNVKVDSTKVSYYQSRGYVLGMCPISPDH